MKKFIVKASVLAIFATGALMLQGCDNTSNQADTPGGDGNNNTVILYSNAISDGRGEWIQERVLADIGLEVLLVDAGGVEIRNRLLAEAQNPVADVVFGLNQMLWYSLLQENIAVPYVPTWANEIPAGLNNPNGYFHAVALVGNLLAYDTAQISSAQAPTDWLDLWQNPYFHGRYALPNALGGSTIQMVLSGIISRYLDADGHLGVSAQGWEHIANKFRYGTTTDQDLFAEIANPNNDVALAQIWHMGLPVREEQFDLTCNIVIPSVGVPFSVEAVGLINGASNPEGAKEFIEWFGSAEVIRDFGIAFEYLPANPNAHEGLSDATMRIASLPMQDIDWDTVSANMNDWVEHIILTYMP